MSLRDQGTKLVRIVFTREQIFTHKGDIVLEVPADMTTEEITTLDNDELIDLPWRPFAKPQYGDEPDRDRVCIESVEEIETSTGSVDGVVTRDEEGEASVASV